PLSPGMPSAPHLNRRRELTWTPLTPTLMGSDWSVCGRLVAEPLAGEHCTPPGALTSEERSCPGWLVRDAVEYSWGVVPFEH
ncbi:MAG: hypothetical protein ACC658_15865, partial [Acidimicrobiia bacterium]